MNANVNVRVRSSRWERGWFDATDIGMAGREGKVRVDLVLSRWPKCSRNERGMPAGSGRTGRFGERIFRWLVKARWVMIWRRTSCKRVEDEAQLVLPSTFLPGDCAARASNQTTVTMADGVT